MNAVLRNVGFSLAVAWSLFQLGVGLTVGLPDLIFLPIHVGFALAVSFILIPFREGMGHDEEIIVRSRGVIDIATSITAAFAAVAISAYYVLNYEALSLRIPLVDPLTTVQMTVGIALVLLVIEATRRTAGMGMVTVVAIFICYAFFGWALPGSLATSPIGIGEFIDQQVFTTEGIFGSPISISATYVFYFVLFAAFLEISGGGKLFIDMSLHLTRRAKGGAAKAAVVSSALMGMTNGSAVANVMSVGVFTIPLMKKSGYPARFAGAIEALASTGGQIMPPLMGAAAFIMANTLGLSYGHIVIAATIPALLYYVAVFITVDLEARRSSIGGVPAEGGIEEGYLKRLHLLIPLLYIVYAIVSGHSLMMSALQAIGFVILVSWFSAETRLWPGRIFSILSSGAARVISVAIPCAAAGMIVAVVSQTGIGIRFTEFLVGIAGSSLILALVVVMVGCIVMGMGLPTTAS